MEVEKEEEEDKRTCDLGKTMSGATFEKYRNLRGSKTDRRCQV